MVDRNKQIRLYQRQPYGQILSRGGIAVEIFKNWEHQAPDHHWHDILEMNFIARGNASQIIDGVISKVGQHTFTIVNYNQCHNIFTESEPVDIINIYVDLEKIRLDRIPDGMKPTLRQLLPLHPIFGHDLNRLTQLKIDAPDELSNLLYAINEEQTSQKDGYMEAIYNYFNLMLILICRCAGKIKRQNNRVSGIAYNRVEKVLFYVNENLHKPLKLDTIAQVAGINKHYLCREFKETTSKTLMQYIIERRIEKAMFALRTTNGKILEISLDCGFEDCSNFNRYFKKATGVSPGSYRRKFKIK